MTHRLPAGTSTSAEGILWIFSAVWFGMLAFIGSVAPVDAGLVCAVDPRGSSSRPAERQPDSTYPLC